MSVVPLHPVAVPELRLLGGDRQWEVNQAIEGLPSLTPVRGHLRVQHHGDVLEVEGVVSTIVTLRCDRCLNHFNQELQAEARELLELLPATVSRQAGGPTRAELSAEQGSSQRQVSGLGGGAIDATELIAAGEDLDDRLDSEGTFDPERWLFEQLSLRLPLVNRCGADCPGPATWSSEAGGGDPRWAALRRLSQS